jgi:L-xylulokinase
MDRRATSVSEKWQTRPIADQLLKQTANHVWPGQPLPLLAHLREEGRLPESFRLLFCKDWLRWRLTGEMVTDQTDASAAGLIDIHTGEWAEQAFIAAGLPMLTSALPGLVNSSTRTGVVCNAAAKATGLRAGTPVFGGGIDLALGAIADGLTEAGLLHVTAGTWSINQQLLQNDAPSAVPNCLQIICAPNGRSRILVDSSPTSAINLDVLCALTGQSSPDFTRWEPLVEATCLEPDDPIYLPYPAGAWDIACDSAGLRQLHAGLTFDRIVRAVYEGIVLGHLRQIRKFQEAGTVARLVACGGLTRSEAWCRMLCNYAQLPLHVSDNPHATSRGAARLVLKGLGIPAPKRSQTGRSYRPEPDRVCQERIQKFNRILKEDTPWT